MRKKKYYSPEFKQEAVRLAEASGNKSQVARDLGIHATVIGKWQKQLQTPGKQAFPGQGRPRDEEMFQLKKENRRLQQEVEILKKAVGGSRAVSSASAPREIPIHPGALPPWRGQEFSIVIMCKVLAVSRSGYYAWLRRSESKRSQKNKQLVQQIENIHQQSSCTYGSPRVYNELRDRGVMCSENKVARLMRQYGIAADKKRKFTQTTDSNHSLPVAPNRLNQQFEADRPNAVWTADITGRRARIYGLGRGGYI